MKQIRVMIAGFGNVGRGVKMAIEKNPDMVLAGVVSRSPERVRRELPGVAVCHIADVAGWKAELNPDVAILCGGSKNDLPEQGPVLCREITTVDSFDNHSRIPEYFEAMDRNARETGHAAVISTGWDPGVFSMERVLANAFLPGRRAYGFYGTTEKGGLSMGHSDALRTIEGVADARQFTHAVPEAMDAVRRGEAPDFAPGDMHTRECFVVLKPGADAAKVERTIREMPGYFAPYHTEIHFVSQDELNAEYKTFQHDGCVIASGTTGAGNGALVEFRCRWGSNPEATAQILAAHARAAYRLAREGRSGAFTILDIPAAYLSMHSREELLRRWM